VAVTVTVAVAVAVVVGIARLIFNAEVVQICQKVAYSQFVIPRLIYQIIL